MQRRWGLGQHRRSIAVRTDRPAAVRLTRPAVQRAGTEWESSEQTGLAALLKGPLGMFRNPTAHAPRVLYATSRKDALDMLTLASILHRRLDTATVRKRRSGPTRDRPLGPAPVAPSALSSEIICR
jgi:hypothetical protein